MAPRRFLSFIICQLSWLFLGKWSGGLLRSRSSNPRMPILIFYSTIAEEEKNCTHFILEIFCAKENGTDEIGI